MGGAPVKNNGLVESIPEPENETSHDQYRIFNDEPKVGNLALNFDDYVNSISNIILHSKPPYTVGIFGSWGTGKSSVMKNVEAKIDGICDFFEFNAWRFEREENHATIPLLISIITTLWKKLEKEKPDSLKEVDIHQVSLSQKILGVLKGLSLNFKVGVPGFGEIGAKYDAGEIELPESKRAESFAKSTFHDGIDLIKEMLGKKKHADGNKNLKLVVFIDDLDRCTPEKAIEVLESIKIFLNLDNIVFVLALSQEIVEMAVEAKYKDLIEIFSGKDYLKKIIQLPILLPIWNDKQIKEFLEHILKEYHNEEQKKLFLKHKELIVSSVESNPREVLRLLNNFIFAKQVFKDKRVGGKKINDEKLLAVQATRLRWPKFYEMIKDNPESMDRIKGIIQ